MKSLKILGLVFSFASLLHAAPLGNPKAAKGGTFNIGSQSYPAHLLLYIANDEPANAVNSVVVETLLDMDLQTYDFIPLLASEWKVSTDQKTFTFKLNPAAKFSDGTPVTAKDVKFTWDTITDKKNKTPVYQAVYSSFESCKVIDERTVEFRAKTLHFKNLEKVAGLMILPEHIYSKGDFNKAFHSTLVGSGPYKLEKLTKGEKIFLRRDENYWGKDLPQNIGRYNFDRIVYKYVEDPNVQFELFKKGELDYFVFYSSKMWTTETNGPSFQKNYITKIRADNLLQYGTQGIAWNLRRPMFQDKKVRMALSHLMNRERWIKDLFFNNYVLAAGPVGTTSPYHAPGNKPIPFDPKKAAELLKEAGWGTVGGDGIRTKDGKRFEFDLLTNSQGSQKYLTLYQEDLRKAGIKMNIRLMDWAGAMKLADDWQFDAYEQNRSRDVDPSDFNLQWGTDQASIKGSANHTGYSNPEVDALSKQIDETFDRKKRIPLVQKLDEMIGRDQPMSFAWEATYFRIAAWNRYSYPGKGYYPYSSWMSAFQFWWLDKDKDAKLQAAMKSGGALSN